MSDAALLAAGTAAEPLDPRERQFRIPSQLPGLRLFLRLLAPARETATPARPVLYVHGATFPSALSIAHRFDGRSWRDALAEAGFAVWGLDFLGFGHSDRYPAMAEAAERGRPLGTASDAAPQIARAARFILAHHGAPRLSLIAHSWGSIAAGCFAAADRALLDRLVLFAPISRREPSRPEGGASPDPAPALGAWRLVTVEEQWRRFIEDVPAGEAPVLARRHFEEWAPRYLASDPESHARRPPAVKVPSGPAADIRDAWHGGLAYDPARIAAPVLIARGEWDRTTSAADARWLHGALTGAAAKRLVTIPRATHLMHLEEGRHALHDAVTAFLGAGEAATAPTARQRSQAQGD
jgi:pimeloyl-ACP methyl ester carboxylesterase